MSQRTNLLQIIEDAKTDEELRQYLICNTPKSLTVAENKEYLQKCCEKRFLQSIQLLLPLTVNKNSKSYSFTANPCSTLLFFQSTDENYYELIDYLISNNFPISAKKSTGRTVLHNAIRNKNLQLLRYLIIDKKLLKHKPLLLCELFFYSISHKFSSIVDFFLDEIIVNINIKDEYHFNALHIAALMNDIEFAKKVIDRGIDFHAVTKNRQNAFHIAVHYKNFEFAHFLIAETSIDIYSLDLLDNSSLLLTLALASSKNSRKNHFNYVKMNNNILKNRSKNIKEAQFDEDRNSNIFLFAVYLIEEKRMQYDIMNKEGDDALTLSIKANQPQFAKYLIEQMNVNIHRRINILGLSIVMRLEDFSMYLIEKGVEFRAYDLLQISIQHQLPLLSRYFYEKQNSKYQTLDLALYFSVIYNVPELVSYFLSLHESKRNFHYGYSKKSLLMGAIQHRHYKLARSLVDEGLVDVNQKDNRGESALSYLIRNNQFDFAKYLIEEKGMEYMYDRNDSTVSVLKRVAENPSVESLQFAKYLIEKKGYNMNLELCENNALHSAVEFNRLEFIRYLIDDCNMKLDNRVLRIAASRRVALDIVKYLIEEKKMDIFQQENSEKNLLQLAIEANSINVARYLIQRGMNSNSIGQSIFRVCDHFYFSNRKFLQYLIDECNFNPFILDENGASLLCILLKHCCFSKDFFQYLVHLGLDVNHVDNRGRDLFNYIQFYPEERQLIVLKSGYNLDTELAERNFLQFIKSNYYHSATKMIEHGININCKRPTSALGIELQKLIPKLDFIWYLLSKGADLVDLNRNHDNAWKILESRRINEWKKIENYILLKTLDASCSNRNLYSSKPQWKTIFALSVTRSVDKLLQILEKERIPWFRGLI